MLHSITYFFLYFLSIKFWVFLPFVNIQQMLSINADQNFCFFPLNFCLLFFFSYHIRKKKPVWNFEVDNYGNFCDMSIISVSVRASSSEWKESTIRIQNDIALKHQNIHGDTKRYLGNLLLWRFKKVPWKMCLVECLCKLQKKPIVISQRALT